MKTLLIAGLASVLAMAPATANAAIDSLPSNGSGAPLVDVTFTSSAALVAGLQGAKTRMPRMNGHRMKNMGNMHRKQGHRMNRGRHMSGKHVRQGRMGYGRGYRRPHRGFRLPSTFIRPSYFIGNFGHYGLRQPSFGYGWSRYYDDAVLTDRRGVVQETRRNVDWDRYNQGYNDGYRDGQARYDTRVLIGDDRVVARPTNVISGGSTYQGDWNGTYREDGSYECDWQGIYRDADGREYQGQYSGTFIGDGNVSQTGADYAQSSPHWGDQREYRDDAGRYDDRDELAYLERCKKSSGIGGALVGGAIGALAGNRIAGRGNRLGGSLIGGGLGAIAGAAIDQGSDRCRRLIKKYGEGERYVQRAPNRQRYAPRPQQQYPTGWQGQYPSYYYPQQQPMVTTVVIQSAPVTTTTTTTYIDEEVVYAKPKYTKKRWKPAAKRVWKPRPEPVKGCQQERCLYND